ncbi:transposase [Klebsiella pneumoniae]|uniref:Transposase n=1 Tax=Klebsiella pneumoniae TaxID=573 RepID=A0A377XEE6_KLEPN|nr:transposase [Klebsiella pneumoniae]
MHRLGEIKDRKPENQSYRASGLTLLTAAISLWNTVYMERAVDAMKRKGVKINGLLLSHLSPLGWEHINLTGDYIWKSNRIPASGKFRRLRPAKVKVKNNLNVQKFSISKLTPITTVPQITISFTQNTCGIAAVFLLMGLITPAHERMPASDTRLLSYFF